MAQYEHHVLLQVLVMQFQFGRGRGMDIFGREKELNRENNKSPAVMLAKGKLQ